MWLIQKNQQRKFNGRKMLNWPCEEERETDNSHFIRPFVLLSECIAHLSFWSNLEMPPILDPPMSEKFLLSLELLSQKVAFISQLIFEILDFLEPCNLIGWQHSGDNSITIILPGIGKLKGKISPKKQQIYFWPFLLQYDQKWIFCKIRLCQFLDHPIT